jgi:hypothetical protein
MLPLKSSDNYLVEGVPFADLELDVPQQTLVWIFFVYDSDVTSPLHPTRKETPNKQFEPIRCLDRDHDPEVMTTIEVG